MIKKIALLALLAVSPLCATLKVTVVNSNLSEMNLVAASNENGEITVSINSSDDQSTVVPNVQLNNETTVDLQDGNGNAIGYITFVVTDEEEVSAVAAE